MVEHDFRYSLLTPQHTLIECKAMSPGRYQVTGNGGAVRAGDVLLVTLKGSQTLSMRLTVEKARHLINPVGQWTAVAQGAVFKALAIHRWDVNCDACGKAMNFEFAVDSSLGEAALQPAAAARIAELGWRSEGERHFCPACPAQ